TEKALLEIAEGNRALCGERRRQWHVANGVKGGWQLLPNRGRSRDRDQRQADATEHQTATDCTHFPITATSGTCAALFARSSAARSPWASVAGSLLAQKCM